MSYGNYNSHSQWQMHDEITYAYYKTLIEMGMRHKVRRVVRQNGTHIYYTYHLN